MYLHIIRRKRKNSEAAAKAAKATPATLVEKIGHLMAELKALQSENESLKSKAAKEALGDVMDQVVEVKGVKLLAVSVDGVDMNGLRDLGDQLKGKLGEGVIVLASASDGKVNLLPWRQTMRWRTAHMPAISSRALRVKSAEAVVDVRTWRRQAVRIRRHSGCHCRGENGT